LHVLGNKHVVKLDQQVFEVTRSADGEHRIRHPRRPDAYAPTLRHNSHGAWVGESENPRQWQGPQLMRRIGHATDGFSDAQLEQIRQLTGTDENILRRMHVENTPPPPLLADTLLRLASHPAPKDVAQALSAPAARVLRDCPQLTPVLAERVIGLARPLEMQRITLRRCRCV
jgi:hypothetical protein